MRGRTEAFFRSGHPIATEERTRDQPLRSCGAALADLDRATAAATAGVPETDPEELSGSIRRKGHVVVESGTGIPIEIGVCRPDLMVNVYVLRKGNQRKDQ